ncbi:MAG: pilus (MSHA type) biogenesis protein MshL [Nitrospirae bacterium]|nr:pilus (MSHA type) biogenesis protein MshL [Nitrospirota bacterium]
MAQNRINKLLSSVFCSCLLFSCAAENLKREVTIPADVYNVKPEEPIVKEPAMPDFVPASEDVSPLKTRIVDVVARNTALRDVLYVIAEATGLNLVMERGVSPETPVTMTLRNVSAEDALNTIFSSVDYFYTITNNMLVVKAQDTRIFELGRPSVIQSYNVDVGGDIIGSALAGIPSSSGSGSSGGSSSAGSLKGSVTQSSKNDAAAFSFWDAVEKSLTVILGQPVAAPAAPAAPAQGQPAAQQQAAAPVQQNFTVNRMTGTIVVTASKQNLDRVEQYINAIKKVINRQVLIEAKIIEVQLSDGLKYGIDWAQAFKNWRGVGPLAIGQSGFSSVVTSAMPAFKVNITGSNFSALLQALQQQGEVRTLSNPRVNIMNGQTSLLSVGRSQTFISNVSTSTPTNTANPVTTFSIGTSSVLSGIILGIVPFINDNGEISLTITPIISNLVQLTNTSVGQTGNQTQISLPTVDLRELSTTVKVRDGQMVIIGGLISKSESLQNNKMPGLGDAPYVGKLFTNVDKTESRTELVVVLQPVIIAK